MASMSRRFVVLSLVLSLLLALAGGRGRTWGESLWWI